MSSPPAARIPLPASPPPAEAEDQQPTSISTRLDASETATAPDSAGSQDEHPATPAPDVVIQQPSPVPSSASAPVIEPRSPPPSHGTPNPTPSDLPPQPTTPSTAPPPTPPAKPRGAEALRRDSVVTMGSGAFSPGQSTVSLASVPTNGPAHRRSLTISRSSLGGGQTSHVSAVLITSAPDATASSREAKRSPALRSAVDKALELIKAGEAGSRVREVFEPLRLACESKAEKIQVGDYW